MRRTTLFTLEVTLTGGYMTEEFEALNPVISRTIEIRADQTLNQLHWTIFKAFGRWDDCHLHEFNLGDGVMDRGGDRYVLQFVYDNPEGYHEDERPTGSVTQTRLGKLGLEVGRTFWYWYDLGDDWQHRITVTAIGEAEPGTTYPRVVAGVGESPPQYPPLDEDADAPTSAEGYLGPSVDPVEAKIGRMSFIDGSVVEWTRTEVPGEEARLLHDGRDARTFRVRTLRERPDGSGVVTTYTLPGAWLGVWLSELLGRTDGDEETILSVWTV